jgi:hypothetical protein
MGCDSYGPHSLRWNITKEKIKAIRTLVVADPFFWPNGSYGRPLQHGQESQFVGELLLTSARYLATQRSLRKDPHGTFKHARRFWSDAAC